MRVSVGADDITPVTDALLAALLERGIEPLLHGPLGEEPAAWAAVAEAVARDVTEGRADTGIACCYTGTGVSMAANKVPGARAALCMDPEIARGAREWNDANVLCLSLMRTAPEAVGAILDAWLGPVAVDEEERPSIDHLARLDAGR